MSTKGKRKPTVKRRSRRKLPTAKKEAETNSVDEFRASYEASMPTEYLEIPESRRRELDIQAEVYPTMAESMETEACWLKWIDEQAEKLPADKRAAFIQNEMGTINGEFDVHPVETLADVIASMPRPPVTPAEVDYLNWRSTGNLHISRLEKDVRLIAMQRRLDALTPPQRPCTILPSFKVITIDGNVIKLAGSLKKRIFLIYLFRWKKTNPSGMFHFDEILEDLNKLLPESKPIKSESLNYALFKGMPKKEFGLLFEIHDVDTAKYRLIPDAPNDFDLDKAFERALSDYSSSVFK